MHYAPSELVLNDKGQVYHLGLSPDQIADTILLVGDQDRVEMISTFFDSITHKSQHREFVCHTGIYNGKSISAISTGIGTDNIDIVVNELDALVNINLVERSNNATPKSLNLIRIGTCGILQADIPVHSYILSTHALGLDNVGHFYEIESSEIEQEILHEFNSQVDLPNAVIPYFVAANEGLINKLISTRTHEGITVTSSGFYGPQGRELRLKTKTTGLNEQLTNFSFKHHQVTNFEMESSALFAIGRSLGHQCATICLGVANRPKMEFSKGYSSEMLSLIQYVLDRV
ncbi:MAG: nucleoside phosphorylase [Bacteroidota bacterium]